jgi:serine/threonine-protein kinase
MVELRDRLARGLAGRYENLRELGAGGMAVVYLAHDIRHGRDVAIKVLRDEVARSVGADRFLGEIHLAAKLAHPHILPLYDSGEAEGIVYFVMPNIEGRSVRDRLARRFWRRCVIQGPFSRHAIAAPAARGRHAAPLFA